MSDKTNWEALFTEFRSAKDALEEAEIAESQARSRTTAATNRLNKAQGDINRAIQEEKKAASPRSDWHRELHPPQSVMG